MTRYYIRNSSIFDSEPYYQAEKIKKLVQEAGGKNVRLSRWHGWSNQPKVVCYDASSAAVAEKIASYVAAELGKKYPRFRTWGVHSDIKFWG